MIPALFDQVGTTAGALVYVVAGAVAVLFAVLLFSVIPGVVRDLVADARSARVATERAATVPLKKEV